MGKNAMPSISDFDAWTDADEEKALEATAKTMRVKHVIKDGSVWFLAPNGRVYKLPVALSIDDFDRLSNLQSDSEQIQALKDMLAAFAGETAAEQLAKEPVMVPLNILNDYGRIISRIQGVELGKSSRSSESSKVRMETE
mgnify:CR=1 FL=1